MPAEFEPGSSANNDLDVNWGETTEPSFRTPATGEVTIDSDKLKFNITSVKLTQPIDSHHVLQIRVHRDIVSGTEDIAESASFSAFLGSSVSLSIAAEGKILSGVGTLDFIGIVTKISLESQIDGLNDVLITAHSPTIAMDGARKNKVFLDSKPSDCISSVLGSNPITIGNVDTAGDQRVYSVQLDETDYKFVMRTSGASGLFAFYDGKAFNATKASGSAANKLNWRETLGGFSLGLGTGMISFDSAAWDSSKKNLLTGEKVRKDISGAPAGLSLKSLDASEKIYGDSNRSFTTRTIIPTQAAVDKAVLRDTEAAVGGLIRATGISIDPGLKVGSCVKVVGMGDIDNSYWVLKVTHFLSDGGQYHNKFECCPLDVAYPSVNPTRQPANSIFFTKVVDNDDPENLGRVKVELPWSKAAETTWARVVTPDAGAGHGFYAVPDIDDEVLVAYDQGDPDRPIVIGSAFNKIDKPPVDAAESIGDGGNFLKKFSTKSGNEIIFDDTKDKERILITQPEGQTSITLTLDSDKPTIILKSEGNISIEGEGDIAIESKGNMDIKAGGAMTVSTGQGDLELDSAGAIKQKAGSNVDVTAGANCTIKGGANTKVEGGAMLDLKGGTMVKVQGAMIKLN